MQITNRYGETGAIPYRSGRFYYVDGAWWFAIRRGLDQGPYLTKSSAKRALIEFLNDQFSFERFLQQDLQVLRAAQK